MMPAHKSWFSWMLLAFTLTLTSALPAGVDAADDASPPTTQPAVNQTAPDFSLTTLDDKTVSLSKLIEDGPTVLIVLRGWPGYQCPICTRQVGEFMSQAQEFQAEKAHVLLVYPGPAEQLDVHAREFISGTALPPGFVFVTDPDLKFVSSWGLRWNAKGETAYPATFVIDRKSIIRFAKISQAHGGRAPAADVLNALKARAD